MRQYMASPESTHTKFESCASRAQYIIRFKSAQIILVRANAFFDKCLDRVILPIDSVWNRLPIFY